MRQTRSAVLDFVSNGLSLGALAGLVVLTLVDRGATRMYATPWNAVLWFIQIAPVVALLFRALNRYDRFWPPARRLTIAAVAFGTAVIASALASPYQGPSVLAAIMPLAGIAVFFLVHDWLARDTVQRQRQLVLAAGLAAVAVSLVSLAQWAAYDLHAVHRWAEFVRQLQARNEHPLGHSNYTAGLALLALPWPAMLALNNRGFARAGWAAATLLPLAMLFTSASRGGVIGLAALGGAALWQARLRRRELLLAFVAAILAGVALAYAHPRTRELIFRTGTIAGPNLSNVQRTAMAKAGVLMAQARPLLGWGPGSTPLAFPKFRAQLDGGVENAYQLHSTPVQILAELGLLGTGAAGGLAVLVFAAAVRIRRSRIGEPPRPAEAAAALAFTGYAAFALTDYQLDVPAFTFAVAIVGATLATPAKVPAAPRMRGIVIATGVAVLALLAFLGRPDPTPEINVRALALAKTPAGANEAIALLRESLTQNPDQEIAHFNLGWLLVVRDPAAAEAHFVAAAHLVPDKGGVYFGLALARLNQHRPGDNRDVIHALALECLNDPAFLISPWWRQPALGALREQTVGELRSMASATALRLAARDDARSRDADFLPALAEWLDGRGEPGEILARSWTPARVTYFAARPEIPAWTTAPAIGYRRERPAYPILAHNLDLPPPVDVYDVQENSLLKGEFGGVFPPKGWLPGPLLIERLEESHP